MTNIVTNVAAGLDAHGNPMTADRDTIARYDAAVDRLLRYSPAVIDAMTDLIEDDGAVAMGLAFGAYLHLTSTDPRDLASARALHTSMAGTTMNERETLHASAIGAWIDGSWTGAARTLDEVLVRWPTDVLALIVGHQLDFFLGDAASLRDRPLRMLRELGTEHPHVGFVQGMASFGLEEAGHYEQALDAGLAAVDAHPDDVWAVHAIAHTYEMQGRVVDGIRFMTAENTTWGADNLFTVHLWWHLGLYQLEAGRIDDVLAIYDAEVHHADSAGVPLEMLDASAMLWRLHLDGVDTGARFSQLADAWQPLTTSDPWYAFNDLHAVIADVGAGRIGAARTVVDRLEVAASAATGTNRMMTAEVGLPASRAVIAHAEGRFGDAVAELFPIRRQLHRFGGSHAQRDVLQRTLLDAAIRDGQLELARALTAERLGMRDTSVYSWMQRARVLAAQGDATGSVAASTAADRHRAALAQAG
jgi:hypothetical protein